MTAGLDFDTLRVDDVTRVFGRRRAVAHVSFEAPAGKYEWMNQHIFVGTVGAGLPDKPSVRLMIYKLS